MHGAPRLCCVPDAAESEKRALRAEIRERRRIRTSTERAAAATATRPASSSASKPAAKAAPPPPPPTRTKLSYKDQRDYDLLPTRIEEIQAQIARDEAALHDPALYTRDPTKFAALTGAIEAARAEKDAAEERWLELAEIVENST